MKQKNEIKEKDKIFNEWKCKTTDDLPRTTEGCNRCLKRIIQETSKQFEKKIKELEKFIREDIEVIKLKNREIKQLKKQLKDRDKKIKDRIEEIKKECKKTSKEWWHNIIIKELQTLLKDIKE